MADAQKIEVQPKGGAAAPAPLAPATPKLATKSSQAKKSSGKKKKSSVPSKPRIPWTLRAKEAWKLVADNSNEVFQGLKSPDRLTRQMSALFVVCVAGTILFSTWTLVRLKSRLHFEKKKVQVAEASASKNLGEFFRKQHDEAMIKAVMANLGSFTLELKAVPGMKVGPGANNIAEIEIEAECESKETRLFIEANLPQVKNELTNVFTALDRAELLSRDGKRKLKKQIRDRLNKWLPSGKVVELYISKLIVS